MCKFFYIFLSYQIKKTTTRFFCHSNMVIEMKSEKGSIFIFSVPNIINFTLPVEGTAY